MKRIILLLFVSVFLSAPASANEGIYASGNTRYTQQKVDSQAQKLIEQMVIATIIEKTGKIVTDFMKSQNINVFPQITYNAVQMIAMQVFKQEALKSFPQDAYKDAVDKFRELRDKGASPQQMQNQIRNVINGILDPLRDEYVYQEVIKLGVKEAMVQNRKIIVMAVAQQQAQLAAIQAQHIYMQQMMQRYYQEAIQQAMAQRMQAIQRERIEQVQQVERQYRQIQQDYYKQQQILKNQYEQEMRRRALHEQQRLRN